MKLKGVKKLQKNITALLVAYVYDDLCEAKLNTDFLAEYWHDVIYFSPFIMETYDTAMREEVRKHFNFNIPTNGMFLFSCLHEIGHCATMEHFTGDEIEVQQDVINYLKSGKVPSPIMPYYYSIPIEYQANKWAVNWCREKGVEVFDELNCALMEELNVWYDKNNVVGG